MDTKKQLNWILIRGLSREARHWESFPNLLNQEFSNSKVHVLDLPGVGTKHLQKSPSRIEDFVEALRKEFLALKENHPHQNWAILCVSLGGMIGLSWVNKYPLDFERIATINSSGGDLSLPWQRLSPLAIKQILKLFFKNDLYERERVVLELTTSMTEITDELVNKWKSYAEDSPLKREVFLKQVFAASRFKVPNKMPIPYLCISGAKDKLTNPECSKALAKHFRVPHQIHPSAGHDLALDDPLWLKETLVRWVQGDQLK